jgi:hypothetical protein
MKRIFATLIFAVISVTLLAQSFTLQGRVTDQENNPVELASVVSQGKLTMTNLNGEFSIQLQSADSVEVRFSMIGYKTKTRVLRRPKGKMTLQVQLFDAGLLDEVVITEQRRQTGTTQEIDTKQMSTTPSASGNKV